MRADKTFLINFTNGGFNQYHNDILKRVVDDYLESHPDLLLDKRIPALTGLYKVSPDSVLLKPALIERRSDSNKEVCHE